MSPREAALEILRLRFQSRPPIPSVLDLAPHQEEAIARAREIMARRNGVLIADSVGLGKTFVGLGLIELCPGPVLVVVPASLRPMWRRELRRLTARTDLISHTRLATRAPPRATYELVLVDEAHGFRNPRTARYRALKAACQGCKVVLLTATPVNNSLADLFFLLRLFCSDSAFRDLGIGSLRRALESDAARAQDLERIRDAVVIRRTRADVSRCHKSFSFPERVALHTVPYQLPMRPERLGTYLDQLTYPAYHFRTAFAGDLLRFGLLKRLESSLHALRSTLGMQIAFYDQLIESLTRGERLTAAVFKRLYSRSDNVLQLPLDGFASLCPVPDYSNLETAARRERQVLAAWRTEVEHVVDDKLENVLALLLCREGRKTVVFTEFRDTAKYLWRAARKRFPTALIDGSGAWIGELPASRGQVIERFAPVANGGRNFPSRERIDVLIATDVMAEGLNLQDADAVVSYDLPWNPIRLVQRAGRIDRLGSANLSVDVYNFLPDREFDAFLGLVQTIRAKIETARSAIGLDRPVLDPDEDSSAVTHLVAASNTRLFSSLDRSSEASLRQAWLAAQPQPRPGPVCASMPDAAGRAMLIAWTRDGAVDLEVAGGDRSAQQLLREALDVHDASPVDLNWVECATRDRFRIRCSAAQRDETAAQLAVRLRAGLQRIAIADRTTFERAERLFCRLCEPLSAQLEHRLVHVRDRRFSSFNDFLTALEDILGERIF